MTPLEKAIEALRAVETWLMLPLAAPEEAYAPEYIAARKLVREALDAATERKTPANDQ